MNKILLNPSFSIELGTSYLIPYPVINNDWLTILLFFDEVYTVTVNEETKKLFNPVINIKGHPIEKILSNTDFLSKADPTTEDGQNIILAKICTSENINLIPNPHTTEREKYISTIGRVVPESIKLLKESFLKFDLIQRIILPQLPSIKGNITEELIKAISEYKNSNLFPALVEGVDMLLAKYDGNYFLTPQLESEIQTFLIKRQKEFLKLIDFEKIKSFNFMPILEDGAGALSSLLLPVLPLGTLKEIFNYFKNQRTLENNKEILFVFSLLYLQKVLTDFFVNTEIVEQCPICKLTSIEVDTQTDDEIHNFIMSKTSKMCIDHMVSYLTVRKFTQATGKELLNAIVKNMN